MHHSLDEVSSIRVLFIGDVFSKKGVLAVETLLPDLIEKEKLNFVVANGENSAGYEGITLRYAKRLLTAGVDVITLGNHAFSNKDVENIFKKDFPVIRPFNFKNVSGNGYITIEKKGIKLNVVNAIGRAFLEKLPTSDPFDQILSIVGVFNSGITVVDFHAEATAEKVAMGNFLDGSVSTVVGTHTHVQTADERILPNGTAYITDIGMTGPHDSVIGIKKSIIMEKIKTKERVRYEPAKNGIELQGAISTINLETKEAIDIKRVKIKTDL
jgi:hypothetical protein